MSSEREQKVADQSSDAESAKGETDTRTGQLIEEEEKNLSRHATRDSSPSLSEQERTTVEPDDA
jgi:hypothetical protein